MLKLTREVKITTPGGELGERYTRVQIPVSEREMLLLLVEAVKSTASASTGKQRTHWVALSYLVGIPDTEAVKKANAEAQPAYRITTASFRKWLPTLLSGLTAKILQN